jgi:hypothetical protein
MVELISCSNAQKVLDVSLRNFPIWSSLSNQHSSVCRFEILTHWGSAKQSQKLFPYVEVQGLTSVLYRQASVASPSVHDLYFWKVREPVSTESPAFWIVSNSNCYQLCMQRRVSSRNHPSRRVRSHREGSCCRGCEPFRSPSRPHHPSGVLPPAVHCHNVCSGVPLACASTV